MRDTLGDAASGLGFLRGLGPFLRQTNRASHSGAPLAEPLEETLARRADSFLDVVRGAIITFPSSPYARLLQAAGIDWTRIERLTRQVGVEGTLERLHDAGVFVTLEEFKGLAPIVRPHLQIATQPSDFDNPFDTRGYRARTGGSRGAPRRTVIGLGLLAHEAHYHAGFYAAHGALHSRAALWLPAPPGAVAIKSVLIRARLGLAVDRWFSQSRPSEGGVKHRTFGAAVRLVARAHGWRVPPPGYTAPAEAGRVASWIAECRARGDGAVLLTTPSGAVRTCAVATERRWDISGALFVVVGEPLTPAKLEVISSTGSRVASHYAMVEAGMIGLACRHADAPDDVHLVIDKIATIERRTHRSNGASPSGLLHTTLLPTSPKIMLNVESGDTGVLEDRDCGCGVLPAAFRRHLHSIRSYEKLTSEGMHFMGADLLALVEDVLVRRYGGGLTDWQLVEREVNGLVRVNVVASPGIGALDADDVCRTVLDFLRTRGIGQRLMAEVWENGGTLALVRAEPHVTPGGKIQPLQLL